MLIYKSVRLKESVYNDLVKRQLPSESISQTLERLLALLGKIEGLLERFNLLSYGGKFANTREK